MLAHQCPRCRKGQLCRFDPRDTEPSCLACGYVPYPDEPMPYVTEGRPMGKGASENIYELKRVQAARWRAKRKKRVAQ